MTKSHKGHIRTFIAVAPHRRKSGQALIIIILSSLRNKVYEMTFLHKIISILSESVLKQENKRFPVIFHWDMKDRRVAFLIGRGLLATIFRLRWLANKV